MFLTWSQHINMMLGVIHNMPSFFPLILAPLALLGHWTMSREHQLMPIQHS
jgi:hypothetical protein